MSAQPVPGSQKGTSTQPAEAAPSPATLAGEYLLPDIPSATGLAKRPLPEHVEIFETIQRALSAALEDSA